MCYDVLYIRFLTPARLSRTYAKHFTSDIRLVLLGAIEFFLLVVSKYFSWIVMKYILYDKNVWLKMYIFAISNDYCT